MAISGLGSSLAGLYLNRSGTGRSDSAGDAFSQIFESSRAKEERDRNPAVALPAPADTLDFDPRGMEYQAFLESVYNWRDRVAEEYETDEEKLDAAERDLNKRMDAGNPDSPAAKDAAGVSPIRDHFYNGQDNGTEKANAEKAVDATTDEEQDEAEKNSIAASVFGAVNVDFDLVEELDKAEEENQAADPWESVTYANGRQEYLRNPDHWVANALGAGGFGNTQEWLAARSAAASGSEE